MYKLILVFLVVIVIISCDRGKSKVQNVITSDVALFWRTYDKVIQEQDSLKQIELIQTEYIDKGTIGLEKIIQARNYSSEQYVELINKYPKYWNSIRSNTLKADSITDELNKGIGKFKDIYPEMKPAAIYFTIGAMRTNGTAMDSLVLIGSELAMADANTNISEFEGRTRKWLETYFGTNPINDVVLLNIHEYVHTQQNEMPIKLLYQVLYEGIAEFVSVKVLNTSSSTPAIEFGKNNERVREKFEEEMFYSHNVNEWLWSDAENEFGVRNLGYYIGYQIAELYFEKADDKRAAIKKMIELDYTNETEIEDFVNSTDIFSASLNELHEDFQKKRPTVIDIKPFENKSQTVDPKTKQISIEFSDEMDQNFRNFDYGPLGENNSIRFKRFVGYSDNGRSLTFEIDDLKPNKIYQLIIGSGFRNLKGVPLKPFLIEFKTAAD